jgi:dipeptidyl aminopeptidase/acylaminoacyl peptidase
MKARALAMMALAAAPASARPLTPLDLMSLSRIGASTASSDGHWLVWDQEEIDVAGNRSRHDLWRLDLARAGAQPHKFASRDDADETAPAFASDGSLYFLSNEQDGRHAVYRAAMDGSPLVRVTGAYDLAGFEVSPKGDAILVWADRPVGARSLDDDLAPPNGAGSGRVYDHLFVRHWNRWADGLRSQLFIIPIRNGSAIGGGRNIAPLLVGDAPSKPKGSSEEITWTVDGLAVIFALREAGRIEPLSGNFDIFRAPMSGEKPVANLTRPNPAIDTDPAISPDGRWLAWAATVRPGYESDRRVVWLRDLATGKVRSLTTKWDRSADSLRWAPDSRSIYVTAAEALDHPVFNVAVADGSVRRLTGAGRASDVVPLPDGDILFKLDSLTAPTDFWRLAENGRVTRLTAINSVRLIDVDWPAVVRFTFAGARRDLIHGLILKPPQLRAGAKAPVALLVHGGPQSSFSDSWSYNWNLAALAGHGYAVVTVDFHGSTGYGQAFTDSVNRDWGGKPLQDLKLGLAAAIARFGYLDGNNVCAAGGSYGGYMMNWIEGNWPGRFRCLVQHDGIFDERAMTFETDELAPDRWDFGNQPYYRAPIEYEKWNPVNMVVKWNTPQLVITGEQDFRSPSTQAIAAFTALQDRKVPSRLLSFPDEGHVVAKPRNSLQWYAEVFGWMDQWTKRQDGK